MSGDFLLLNSSSFASSKLTLQSFKLRGRLVHIAGFHSITSAANLHATSSAQRHQVFRQGA